MSLSIALSKNHKAKLYNIGTNLRDSQLASWMIDSSSQLAFLASFGGKQPSPTLYALGLQHLVGHHFFDADGPVFTLDQLRQVPYPEAHVSKLYEIDAPSFVCHNYQTKPNIKWLFLADARGTSQGGVSAVYRVITSSGSAPTTCRSKELNFEVPYVAQCEYNTLYSYMLAS